MMSWNYRVHDVEYNVEDILDEILEADSVLILSNQSAFLATD